MASVAKATLSPAHFLGSSCTPFPRHACSILSLLLLFSSFPFTPFLFLVFEPHLEMLRTDS